MGNETKGLRDINPHNTPRNERGVPEGFRRLTWAEWLAQMPEELRKG